MKKDIRLLLEIDSVYGEITPDAAKYAIQEASAAAMLTGSTFCISVGSLALSLVFFAHVAMSCAFAVIGAFFFLAVFYFRGQMHHHRAIVMAYHQRDHLRAIRQQDKLESELGLLTTHMKKRL